MKIVYKNNSMEEIDLTSDSYMLLKDTDLIDYDWDYKTRSVVTPRIYAFERSLVEKTLSVMVRAGSREEYAEKVRKLTDIFEKDIHAAAPGRLYLNDGYFLTCYIKGKHVGNTWNPYRRQQVFELAVLSESGSWTKVEHYNFNATISEDYASGTGRNHPYNYPYNYSTGATNKKIVNTNAVPCDFEITVFGSCTNPVISIGDVSYQVEADIGIGEYLKINSLDKKIYKVKVNGEKVNLFHYRGRDRVDFFQKIDPGKHTVLWNGSYTFDVDLFYERSEPIWI